MEADILSPHFQDHDKAREYLEAKRWPKGPVCPHCGEMNAVRLQKREGDTHARAGLLQCRGCRKQFSVTVGTIFEDSHIPLNKWLMAYHLMCASKKGISAHQLHRMLGVSYKSAWFMCHRIRYTMSEEPVKSMLAGVVEVDETYVGGKEKGHYQLPPFGKKTPVVALIERGGKVRSMPMERVTKITIKKAVMEHVEQTAHLMTDESKVYNWPVKGGVKIDHRGGEKVDHFLGS